MVTIGSIFPNFAAGTNIGRINFHEWLGDSWGLLFSCPTGAKGGLTLPELSSVLHLVPEYQKCNIKAIALTCDTLASFNNWIENIRVSYPWFPTFGEFNFPIIADYRRELISELQFLDPFQEEKLGSSFDTRAVFIIDPQKRTRLFTLYLTTYGRNFWEIQGIIRTLQSADCGQEAVKMLENMNLD